MISNPLTIPRQVIASIGLMLALAGCGPVTAPTPPPTPPLPSPTSAAGQATASAPAQSPSPTPAAGLPSSGCVHGWVLPVGGSVEFEEGLEILEGQMGVTGVWSVSDMRYFTGPDVPWIIEPHYEVVERWYVRASLVDDPQFRGRWLLEKRTDAIKGVSAVAPFDSTGYESPDWSGFFGEGPPRQYPGLPGEWFGIRYDFVTGEGDSGQPGLPDEVIDCLLGT